MIVILTRESHFRIRFLIATMVMTAENVSNDVDEEVYAGDGDEKSEAREASDGDRRAIADADEAGQMAVSGEAKTPPVLRTSEPPTDAARMLQHTNHVPFRDWCPFCVAGRARSSPHRRVVVSKTADTLPKFQADYRFIYVLWLRAKHSHAIRLWKHAVELHVRKEREI